MVKLGEGDSYDKTIINKKIRAYADITKPASSIGIMLTVPFAAILYAELNGISGTSFIVSRWSDVLFASVTMFLLHGGGQALNQAEDVYMDKEAEHKSTRPIPSGVISEEEARSLAWIFISVGMARAFTINISFGLFSLILAFFAIFYNLEPLRTKKRLWINIIWQSLSRGLLLFPATFAVWGEPLNEVAWALGLIAFFLVLSLQQTADFADVKVDEEFDIRTPAVEYGLDTLVNIMALIIVFMFILISVFIYLGILPNFWSLYLLIIPIGWILWSLKTGPNTISNIGTNHSSWYIYYLCLASLYILPAIELSLF